MATNNQGLLFTIMLGKVVWYICGNIFNSFVGNLLLGFNEIAYSIHIYKLSINIYVKSD